jgi:hypothetical protein
MIKQELKIGNTYRVKRNKEKGDFPQMRYQIKVLEIIDIDIVYKYEFEKDVVKCPILEFETNFTIEKDLGCLIEQPLKEKHTYIIHHKNYPIFYKINVLELTETTIYILYEDKLVKSRLTREEFNLFYNVIEDLGIVLSENKITELLNNSKYN